MSLESSLQILRKVLATDGTSEREKLTHQFQDGVWSEQSLIGPAAIDDVLATAAHDLDFYEPREEWRRQDRSFYADDELEKLVRRVIEDLEQLSGGRAD